MDHPTSTSVSRLVGPAGAHRVPLSVTEAETELSLLPMSQATLNDSLGEWLRRRVQPGLTRVPDGWEDWAQLDLIGFLNDTAGSTPSRRWDVQRQARVYQDADRRADLLFNAESHGEFQPIMVVEILCESPLVPRPDFLNRMHFEAEQLRARYLLPRFAGARRMMLALTLDLATSTALQRHEFGAVAWTSAGYSAMWRELGGGTGGREDGRTGGRPNVAPLGSAATAEVRP